jgi:proteasome lid subunit RPN8/RPN11
MKAQNTLGAHTHVLLIPFARIQKYPKISSPLAGEDKGEGDVTGVHSHPHPLPLPSREREIDS